MDAPNSVKEQATGGDAFVLFAEEGEDTQCWNCGRNGHEQWDCPEERKGKLLRRSGRIGPGKHYAMQEVTIPYCTLSNIPLTVPAAVKSAAEPTNITAWRLEWSIKSRM